MVDPLRTSPRRRSALAAGLLAAALIVAWGPASSVAAAAPSSAASPSARSSGAAEASTAASTQASPAGPRSGRKGRAVPAAPPVTWPKLRAWGAGEELSGEPTQSPAGTEEERVARGKALYGPYCARCHGNDHRGGGGAGQDLVPPPADLTGVLRFRSTPRAARATELDLFRTITRGVRGSAMPPFADLPEADRWALAAYVRSVSALPEAPPLPVPPVPADLDAPARAARGARALQQLGCHGCHGAEGRGDGAIAKALRDDRGRPLPVPDWTQAVPRRSRAPEELYLTLVTGIGGAPMPAFAGQPPELLWDAVAYVRSRLPRRAPAHPQEKQAVDLVVEACEPPPSPPEGR